MDLSAINPWEIAKGGWVAAIAVVAWVGRKHLAEDAKRFERLEDSLTESMQTVTARLTQVSDQMAANHSDILNTLLDQNRDRDNHR